MCKRNLIEVKPNVWCPDGNYIYYHTIIDEKEIDGKLCTVQETQQKVFYIPSECINKIESADCNYNESSSCGQIGEIICYKRDILVDEDEWSKVFRKLGSSVNWECHRINDFMAFALPEIIIWDIEYGDSFSKPIENCFSVIYSSNYKVNMYMNLYDMQIINPNIISHIYHGRARNIELPHYSDYIKRSEIILPISYYGVDCYLLFTVSIETFLSCNPCYLTAFQKQWIKDRYPIIYNSSFLEFPFTDSDRYKLSLDMLNEKITLKTKKYKHASTR